MEIRTTKILLFPLPNITNELGDLITIPNDYNWLAWLHIAEEFVDGWPSVHKLNTVTDYFKTPNRNSSDATLQPSFPFLPWQNIIHVEMHDLPTYPLICLSHSTELLFMLVFYIAGSTQWSEPTRRFYHLVVRSFSAAIHHGKKTARLILACHRLAFSLLGYSRRL